MGVGGPRVGSIHTRDEMTRHRARAGPQPERAVHMHPGLVFLGGLDRLGEGVATAGVDVAGLQADDARPRQLAQTIGERGRPDPALVVCGNRNNTAGTEPEVSKNCVH
jgi:hypothetical protein